MADLERVRIWAEALIRLHLDERVWVFGFDFAKTRFGQCDHRSRRITVSRYLAKAAEDDEVHQVLLHEIAHAIAGPRAGHGPRWLSIARELGYEGGRTHSSPAALEHARWRGVCPAGHEVVRFRRPNRATSCAHCAPRFSPDHLIAWSDLKATG